MLAMVRSVDINQHGNAVKRISLYIQRSDYTIIFSPYYFQRQEAFHGPVNMLKIH